MTSIFAHLYDGDLRRLKIWTIAYICIMALVAGVMSAL